MKLILLLLLGLAALSCAHASTFFQMQVSDRTHQRAISLAMSRSAERGHPVDFRGFFDSTALFGSKRGLSHLAGELAGLLGRETTNRLLEDLRALNHPALAEYSRAMSKSDVTLWMVTRERPHANSEFAHGLASSQLYWCTVVSQLLLQDKMADSLVASWPHNGQLLLALPRGQHPPHARYMAVNPVSSTPLSPEPLLSHQALPAEHPLAKLFQPTEAQGLVPEIFRAELLRKDRQIESLVAATMGSDVRLNIEMLSNIHSRLATGPGAITAQNIIVDWLRTNAPAFTVTTKSFDTTFSANVVARIAGRVHPDKTVVVGCHYDSRSEDIKDPDARAPGSDDNGSNTANLLNLARLISRMGIKTTYSLELHFYSGEEQGLLGSKALAQEYKSTNREVIAMINGDMIGYRLPNTDVTLGMKDKSISEWLLSASAAIAKLYVPGLKVELSASCCSDYMSWHAEGYAAVGLFENAGGASDNPNYHKTTDTPEYLDYAQVQALSRAFAAVSLTFAVPT